MAKVGKPRTYSRRASNTNIFLSKVPAEEHKPPCRVYVFADVLNVLIASTANCHPARVVTSQRSARFIIHPTFSLSRRARADGQTVGSASRSARARARVSGIAARVGDATREICGRGARITGALFSLRRAGRDGVFLADYGA